MKTIFNSWQEMNKEISDKQSAVSEKVEGMCFISLQIGIIGRIYHLSMLKYSFILF